MLKVGTTAVLDLLETDHMPKMVLADAVLSFAPCLISRTALDCHLADGRTETAVELLFQFYEAAQTEFAGAMTRRISCWMFGRKPSPPRQATGSARRQSGLDYQTVALRTVH
jgi:hypothetical protein